MEVERCLKCLRNMTVLCILAMSVRKVAICIASTWILVRVSALGAEMKSPKLNWAVSAVTIVCAAAMMRYHVPEVQMMLEEIQRQAKPVIGEEVLNFGRKLRELRHI